MIACECPHCKAVLTIADEHAGRLGKCTVCGQAFRAPDCGTLEVFDVLPVAGRRRSARTAALAGFALVAGILVGMLVVGALPDRMSDSHTAPPATLAEATEAAAALPKAGSACGIAVLASDIGTQYSVDALADFISAGRFSPVVVDWAWITAHWDKTDFGAVNRLAERLTRDGVPILAMYRPRFLGSPSVAVQTRADGSPAFDHGEEIRYTDAEARRWGYSWGIKILKKCPGISEVIVYNPRNIDDSPEAREALRTDPDAPLKAVARFLAEARDAWRAVRPDSRLGLVSGSSPDSWRFVAEAIDAAHPFLAVQEGADLEQNVREVVQLREVLGTRLSTCLAKVTWGETDKVAPGRLAQLNDTAHAAGLGYFVWTFDTLFDSRLYQPEEVAAAWGVDFARLAGPLQGLRAARQTAAPSANSPQDWLYFVSRENPEGQAPRLELSWGGRQVSVPAAADSVLIAYLADRAWGGHGQLSVNLCDTNRVLLGFDVSGVPPRELVRAELCLDVRPSPVPPKQSFEAGIYLVTEAWNEQSATWQVQPAIDPIPQATLTLEPAAGVVRADVTALVRSWREGVPNNGILIKVLEPMAETQTPPPAPASTAVARASSTVPAYAEFVDGPWKSPALPLPPEESDQEALPWPHEAPGLSTAERDKLRQDIWIINNFPLYQCDDTQAYCHNGLDIVLENGMLVYAMKDGYVKSTAHSTVIIGDAPGDEASWAWAYTHLGNVRVAEGEHVARGTALGQIDFNGLPHLHLERIYSQAPYWGEWCHAILPDRHFTYPDEAPPIVEAPFHFFRNTTNDAFEPDASGAVTVAGDVDIVVGMREQGAYAHSRENGFGDRLAVARIQYEIKNVESGQTNRFTSFDFSRLAIKEGVSDRPFNSQVTNVLYKHPRLLEPERANGDKTVTYYIVTNCPADKPPRELKPDLAQLAWRTAETTSSGVPQFPDGTYDVAVTAWDFSNHSSRGETRVVVQNGQ